MKGQAKLIVSAKIQNELMRMSPALRSEIKKISTNVNDTSVDFYNGSRIYVYTANDNARGNRSNASCREEFRMIDKRIEDTVIAPFQTPRRPPFILLEPYRDMLELYENPVDIYISSSYIDNGDVWMWDIVDNTFKGMLKNDGSVLLAFDESVMILHKLKLIKQLVKEFKKQDPISWKTEFLNLRVKDSLSSFFTYTMLTNNQRLKQVFLPRKPLDVRQKKKNKYAISRQDGEIRVIANDLAFIAGSKNDNSVYSCIRALPEATTHNDENGVVEIVQGYRRQYPYIESTQLGDSKKQALRIRQLYEDFDADYIVIDTRNGGVTVLYALQQIMYDDERGVEYRPLKCMNNEDYSRLCRDPDAPACIYAINASQALNSEIATSFRRNLIEERIDFLVDFNTAKEDILSYDPDYTNEDDLDVQVEFYEKPFLETQAMISECAELQYEKGLNTNAIRIYEKRTGRKDRYTSVSYGSYFIDLLERENMTDESDYDFVPLVN